MMRKHSKHLSLSKYCVCEQPSKKQSSLVNLFKLIFLDLALELLFVWLLDLSLISTLLLDGLFLRLLGTSTLSSSSWSSSAIFSSFTFTIFTAILLLRSSLFAWS